MVRFFSLGATIFAIMAGSALSEIELPDLDYEWDDLEPYISEEVRKELVLEALAISEK